MNSYMPNTPVKQPSIMTYTVTPTRTASLSESDTANNQINIWEEVCIRADGFRLWLATRCCACLSSVPSFALVIIAAVLIMLLIATIPIAFALTYIRPQASTADTSLGTGSKIPFAVYRTHSLWPNDSELVKYEDWDDHISLRTSSLLPKNISTCTVYGFACTGKPSFVISKNRRCDGYPDCDDGSDELDCHECQTSLSCTAASDNKHFGRKLCLVAEHLCDHQTHCLNSEDETIYCKSECAEGEHKCRDAEICIPKEAICDGEEHCPFGDDEKECKGECKNGAKYCDEKEVCIHKRQLCDGSQDCQDGSDEKGCDCASCSGKNSVLCNGTEKLCIAKKKVCDGQKDCSEGEDEEGCPGVCPVPNKEENIEAKLADGELVRCADGALYEWEEACNGVRQQCRQSCSKCNQKMAFQCHSQFTKEMDNNSQVNTTEADEEMGLNVTAHLHVQRTFKECIHRSLFCDGKPDCSDGSDEVDCDCAGTMLECKQGSLPGVRRCYSRSQECDGYSDCFDGQDERNCTECSNGAFLCKSEGRCIPNLGRCDGVKNCQDNSDEEDCTCDECARHSKQMYKCSGSARCFALKEVCDPYSMCPNATKLDKLFCAVRNVDYF